MVDGADLLPPDREQALAAKLAALEQQSQRQLVVATVPSLQGQDIADYGYRLGRAWGIGDAERDDGALLIVAPNERQVRIEVGYGLEPVLTDAVSTLIIQGSILPRFRDDDYAGGIEAGADAIIDQLTLPPEEAQKIAEQAASAARDDDAGFGPFVVFGLFILFFFILPMLFGRGGRRYRGSGVGDLIVWGAANAISSSMSRGSDWSGGGGFGGGFSGGGGGFGGGGASGSW